jgi:hypothetical protein
MAVSSRLRLAVLTLVAASALALLLLLPGSDGGADAAPAAAGKRTPGRQMLLRPQDAGRHYIVLNFGDDGPYRPALFCDLLHPATPPPELAAWLDGDKPRGCFAVYGQILRHGKKLSAPWVVGTGALDAGSEAEAVTGLGLADELLAEAGSGEELAEAAPPGTVGDETRLFRLPHSAFGYRVGGSVIAWRSGDVLAAVFAEGSSHHADDFKALTLAKRQQRKRIEHPSPFPLPPRPGSGR